jgi:hypothetical protein
MQRIAIMPVLSTRKFKLSTAVSSIALTSILAFSQDDSQMPVPEVADTYFKSHALFASRPPVQEAQAWALCTAAYEQAAFIFREMGESSGNIDQVEGLGRGARLSVMMSLAMSGDLAGGPTDTLDEAAAGKIAEDFGRRLDYGKMAMQDWPMTWAARMRADLEDAATEEETMGYIRRVLATMQVCMLNNEMQSQYVNTFREMHLEGLLRVEP